MYIIYKKIASTNQEEKDDPIEIQVQSVKNELQRKWREPINYKKRLTLPRDVGFKMKP